MPLDERDRTAFLLLGKLTPEQAACRAMITYAIYSATNLTRRSPPSSALRMAPLVLESCRQGDARHTRAQRLVATALRRSG